MVGNGGGLTVGKGARGEEGLTNKRKCDTIEY